MVDVETTRRQNILEARAADIRKKMINANFGQQIYTHIDRRYKHSVICSQCEQSMTSMMGYDQEKKFCPYCGAHYASLEAGYGNATARCEMAPREITCDECGDKMGWAAIKGNIMCEKCARELHDRIDELEEDLNV